LVLGKIEEMHIFQFNIINAVSAIRTW
jgi:hypothetical protein